MAGTVAARGVGAADAAGRDGCALAVPADDDDLRSLLRRTEMPGAVRLAFTREPSYFAAHGLGGATEYTLVHRAAGALDGMARLSVDRLHWHAVPERIGYLAELRIEPTARGSTRLLREGFARLREVAAAEGVEHCFTSIAHDNARARTVLEHGGRLGLPAYVPMADLVTLVARVPRRPGVGRPASSAPDEDELTAFLARQARAYQLSLTWDGDRWRALARHGLTARDFCVIREGGRPVAAGAVWDQRAFRQVVVCGYQGTLRLVRPVVALLARFGAAPPLPPPGTVLAQGVLVGAAVDGDRHWRALVRALLARAAARGLDWVTLARDARDPELPGLRRVLRAHAYRTRLYHVRWKSDAHGPGGANASLARPEVALL